MRDRVRRASGVARSRPCALLLLLVLGEGACGDRAERGAEEPRAPLPPQIARHYQKGYAFSQDWFTRNVRLWKALLAPLAGRPGLRYLEVGVYEGMSALWMLENVLTHPSARLTGIDLFPDDIEQRYRANLELSGFAHKATTIRGPSQVELKKLPPRSFDLIYLDGSHKAADVMTDAVLSWQLLETGGLLIFDDYEWSGGHLPLELRPTLAIDAFITAYRNEIEVVVSGYQVVLRKRVDPCAGEFYCSAIGPYVYLWERSLLRRQSDGSEVELSEAEKRLVEALGRSHPFGKTAFEVGAELRAMPGFPELMERLGLDL